MVACSAVQRLFSRLRTLRPWRRRYPPAEVERARACPENTVTPEIPLLNVPLSWTDPWELPGRWTPAPAAEPHGPEETAENARPQPQTAEAVAEAQVAESEAHASYPETPVTDSEPLFPDPWPAYGILRFSPQEGFRMEAFGPSGDPFASETSFALWGQTLEGRPCSLVPAWIGHERGTLGAHARREVAGGAFVLGEHVRGLDEFTMDRARLRFAGLREFLWHPHLGPVGLVERGHTAAGEALLEREVAVAGARLTFRLAWEGPKAVHERQRTRPGEVEVMLDEPAAFDTWMREWVRPLRDLLVFATREPSRPHNFVALFAEEVEPPWWTPEAPRSTKTREVELVQRESLLLLGTPRRDYRGLLFSLGELGNETDRVVDKWFELHRRLEPTAEFLFAALNTRLHLENAVLNLMSAAEGYHRAVHNKQPMTPQRHAELTNSMLAHCATPLERDVYGPRLKHANDLSQRQRLKRLYERASEVFPQRKDAIAAHVSQLVETRNYFIHQDVRHEEVREGKELSLLLQRLVMVLQVNFMCDLGWPKDGIAAPLRRSYEGERVLQVADAERP